MLPRRKTRQIIIGSVKIGGDAPISVQSMTKTDTRDVQSTVRQIRRLEKAGCEIVRVAVVDERAAGAIAEIKKRIRIPLIADIHFHYQLALKAMETGADGIRVNPGNIGGRDRLKALVLRAKELCLPIRIGVNAGSLEKDLLKHFEGATPEAMVESALRTIDEIEDLGFSAVKVQRRIAFSLRSRMSHSILGSRRQEKVQEPLSNRPSASGFC
jgi:(E)-4-hydroxy-3-methylbut-2-enyl-diphosphate synthase